MSTQVQVKVQTPMSRELRDRLVVRSKALGFDSVQAFIRFWATAETEGRKVHFGGDDWGEPSDEAAARLNKWAEEAERDSKAGKLKSYTDVDEFMKGLRREESQPKQAVRKTLSQTY